MCYLTQQDAVKLVKNFFAVKDIKAAQQRLDRFMPGVSRNTAAQILERVDGLERKLTDGGWASASADYGTLFSLDGKASIDGVRNFPGMFCWQRASSLCLTEH